MQDILKRLFFVHQQRALVAEVIFNNIRAGARFLKNVQFERKHNYLPTPPVNNAQYISFGNKRDLCALYRTPN